MTVAERHQNVTLLQPTFFSLTPRYKKTIDFLIMKVIKIGTYIYWLSKNQFELTEFYLRLFLFHPKHIFVNFGDDPFSENGPSIKLNPGSAETSLMCRNFNH